MSRGTHTPETYVKWASDRPTWSNQRIADELGVSEASVRRGLHKAGYQRHLVPTDHTDRHDFFLDKPIRIQGPAMITADWHIPLYDPELVNKVILRSREKGIRKLILAGDFFNYDSLSHYDPKQNDAGLEREHREGLAVMRVLLESFDDIYYIWGNHDGRLSKALGFKMQFKLAMRTVFGELGDAALDKITFSNLDHLWLEPYVGAPKDKCWYICHPKVYSRIPLSGARALAAKHNTNVITAHSHHFAIGHASNGEHTVIEGGGLFDKTKTAYLQSTTTFPEWTQGYCYIDEDNRPHMYSPLWEA